jgi:hypothetical protein
LHGQILENEVVPLLAGGGEPDSWKVDEDSMMSLKIRDVVETVVRWGRSYPRLAAARIDRLGEKRQHLSLG